MHLDQSTSTNKGMENTTEVCLLRESKDWITTTVDKHHLHIIHSNPCRCEATPSSRDQTDGDGDSSEAGRGYGGGGEVSGWAMIKFMVILW